MITASATSDEVQQVVSYRDLDLNDRGDVATLYLRIWQTARKLCGHKGLMPIEFTDYNRRCAEQATARAVERANLSPLTTYAASREDSTEEVEAQANAGIHQASSGR